MKKPLAYPRGFVHLNQAGGWSLAWRNHADGGNHWDSAMYEVPHFVRADLSAACDKAKERVEALWFVLGRGAS